MSASTVNSIAGSAASSAANPVAGSTADSPANSVPANAPADAQTVTDIRHWSDWLFSFRVTRPASMRFRSGEFVMIGLETQTKPILRPYSIASPLWDEELEFYSIKAPNGALTSRLQNVKIGEPVLVRSKPTGTLVLDALAGGRNCYLVATGTGIAPFASLLRDPIIYEKFERVILTHTGRTKKDLAYGEDVMRRVSKDALVGAEAREKLLYYGTTTREPSPVQGRITDLIVSGDMFAHLELPNLSGQDRLMICGSMGLNRDMKEICQNAGLQEGSNSRPGSFLVEKAFIG